MSLSKEMMVKASTLYIVVIVSLLIAIISASLLTIAFYYKLEAIKKVRLDKLLVNMESGRTMILSEGFEKYDEDHVIDLFGDQKDSLILRKEHWGVFELGTVKAFELKDTLKRSFLIGTAFLDPSAIYLADEDRPLSVSGKTQITGDGELPKSGLKPAYVDGEAYAGKELIKGKIKDSERNLPPLNESMLEEIARRLKPQEELPVFNLGDSTSNSFFNPVQIYKMDVSQLSIGAKKIKGKIILVSDTTITIDAATELDGIQIYAPVIRVLSGFKGSCQLFARDSIIVEKDCEFKYPSFAGVFKDGDDGIQPKITIGDGVRFSGILISYEKKESPLQTIISLGKDVLINGEVFATGYIKTERQLTVHGKVYAKRFMMQTPATLYENYLIDLILNRKLLSKYYLSSAVFKRTKQEQKILTWLN